MKNDIQTHNVNSQRPFYISIMRFEVWTVGFDLNTKNMLVLKIIVDCFSAVINYYKIPFDTK